MYMSGLKKTGTFFLAKDVSKVDDIKIKRTVSYFPSPLAHLAFIALLSAYVRCKKHQ